MLSVIVWHGRRWGHRAGAAGRLAGTYGCDNVHKRMCTLSHPYASGGAAAFRPGRLWGVSAQRCVDRAQLADQCNSLTERSSNVTFIGFWLLLLGVR